MIKKIKIFLVPQVRGVSLTQERKASTAESENGASNPSLVLYYVISDKGLNLVIPSLYSFICKTGIQILHLKSGCEPSRHGSVLKCSSMNQEVMV